jgi:integrase
MYSYNSIFHNFKIFSDKKNFPIILPTFYSEFISTTHQDYCLQKVSSYDTIGEWEICLRNTSEKLVEIYLSKLSNFLQWVELYSEGSNYVNLETHQNIPDEIINYYLNEYLIEEQGKGEKSISQHLSALISYYTYLEATGFSNRKNFYIKPKYKEISRRNTRSRTSIKYLTPALITTLVMYAKTKRDALLIRTASECGLRSMENRGLLLNDFKVGTKKHNGLLSLFQEMSIDSHKIEFIYYLQGQYSKGSHGKGGKSRELFISRDLLESIREYWAEERPYSDSEHLFLNNSKNNQNPISKLTPSIIFSNIRKRILKDQQEEKLNPNQQAIEIGHTYHCLRHSFGTNLFYDLSEENNTLFDDVSATSQVYLTVAAVLGHSITGRYGPETTKFYIRSCNIKKHFEFH